jgi:hypothetical protein
VNSVPSDAEVRELASRILGRPEYASWHVSETFVKGLAWLAKLFETDPALFWILAIASLLLLLLIVAHVSYTIRVGMAGRPAAASVEPSASGPWFVAEARALAERGHFLDAARSLQLGSIDLLIRKGHVQLGRADANGVFRRRLRDATLDAGVRDELVALVARLERSLFRDRDEDEDLYRRWERAYAALDAQANAA